MPNPTNYSISSLNPTHIQTAAPNTTDILLLETGDALLLENGTDSLLLEGMDTNFNTNYSKASLNPTNYT